MAVATKKSPSYKRILLKLSGEALLGNYLLPFEAITILLLGALVGAVWIARPR